MSLAPDTPLVARLHPSPNREPRRGGTRADLLLLHYTGLQCVERAIDWLSRPESKVSCHYVIDAAGMITQMVAESERAWHAGVACWHGETDINSRSIGIEIHNPGHDLGYPDFPEPQLRALEALGQDIVARHAIPPERVLAHSDVAPLRKIDPGEKFPWSRLHAAGLGHWVDPQPLHADDPGYGAGVGGPAVTETQLALARYGYDVEPTGEMDVRTQYVLRAFQRHFRPCRVDGRLDASTRETLSRLLAAWTTKSGG